MKVLVLGGTGAMGIHLVQYLAQNNTETFVTTRKPKRNKGTIKYLEGNARDYAFLNGVLKSNKWDAIVDFMVYSTNDFNNIVKTFLDSTDHYIFISSARVYANSEEPITENSSRLLDVSTDEDYLKTDEYALSKARQENILRETGKKNWTIIRPYITYSENRLQLGVLEKEEWLYRALIGKTIVFHADMISKTTTLTYGFDVSLRIAAIIGKNKAKGEIFHITTSETIEWGDVLEIYLNVIEKKIGYKPKILLQNFNDFLKIKPTKYQIIYDRLFNRKFNNSKIKEFEENNIYTKTIDGLNKCLEEFLNNPNFLNINWKSEAKKDKATKDITSLKRIKGKKQKIVYLIYRFIA